MPPIVSIYLCTDWTTGRVKERYLKSENAGDELVGRTLTGIPPTSCNFDISPVYFVQNSEYTDKIKDLLKVAFPVLRNRVASMCRSLIAYFIHHEEFNNANTPEQSPLQLSSYY